MFIIVAVRAQVFPVRPVRGIVMVISVFVVHREQVSRLEVPGRCCWRRKVWVAVL
jgi:hypothetical protein